MKKELTIIFGLVALFLSACNSGPQKPTLFTVEFNSNGGSLVSPQVVEKGSLLEKPSNPEKDGYIFLGWYKEDTFKNVWNFEIDIVNENLILFANYEVDPRLTITFDVCGHGEAPQKQKINDGELPIRPEFLYSADYCFRGWFTDTTYQTEFDFNTPIHKSTTIYAKWTSSIFDLSNIDISHIDPTRKLMALRIDDGMKMYGDSSSDNVRYANAIMKVFDEFNAKNPGFAAHATMFCIGGSGLGNKIYSDSQYQEVVTHAINSGFEIGNHSYLHQSSSEFKKLNAYELNDEYIKTQALIKKYSSKDESLFAPPGGASSSLITKSLPVPIIQWSSGLDPLDYTGKSKQDIFNTLYLNAGESKIALCHQGYMNTVHALEDLLPELMDRNIQVVSISELAKVRGYQIKAGQEYWGFEHLKR